MNNDSEAESVVRTLVGSGYRVEQLLESDVTGRLATVRMISIGEREIFIDLLFASSGIEREVVESASQIEIFPGLSAKVASRSALIALKVLSADIKRRPQDVIDVGNLLRAASDGEISIAYDLVDLITERKYNRNKNLRNELDSYVSDACAGQ